RLRVEHGKIATLFDHLRQIIEGHIAARRRVVEAAIRVFFDDDRLFARARLVAGRCCHAPGIPLLGKMLLCNNSAFARVCVIKLGKRPILNAMDDTEDLARRFLALWADYLTALAAEPKTTELLHKWFTLGNPGQPKAPATDTGTAGSAIGAAAVSGTSRERDDAMAELTRRVDELERRLAALERSARPASRVRPRARSTGNPQT